MCISDLDPDVVEMLLRYCYGCLQELPSDHAQVSTTIQALTAWSLPHRVQDVLSGGLALCQRLGLALKRLSSQALKVVQS